MPVARTESATEVVISGVTLETVQEELRKAGIKPGQRVSLRVSDPGREFLRLAEEVSGRAKALGLTDAELERLLED